MNYLQEHRTWSQVRRKPAQLWLWSLQQQHQTRHTPAHATLFRVFALITEPWLSMLQDSYMEQAEYTTSACLILHIVLLPRQPIRVSEQSFIRVFSDLSLFPCLKDWRKWQSGVHCNLCNLYTPKAVCFVMWLRTRPQREFAASSHYGLCDILCLSRLLPVLSWCYTIWCLAWFFCHIV